jgi:hypothetical protein
MIIGIILLLVKKASIAGILVIGYMIWRSLSKDKYRRAQENMMFEAWLRRVRSYFHGLSQNISKTKQKFIDNRKYTILACPKCSAKLRVPKRKGNIIVTCKVCRNEFRVKT